MQMKVAKMPLELVHYLVKYICVAPKA